MILNVPAFWHNSPNFGDALTPWLIKRITGYDAVWTNDDQVKKYMITGSILNDPIAESCIVWGAGIAHRDTYIRKPLEIKAVRGPRTREAMMRSGVECPEVYGDPGLLLPRFIPLVPEPPTHNGYTLGIIPHMIDYTTVRKRYPQLPMVKIIDLTLPVEEVVAQIQSCNVLVSSSLHGVIVSHAYNRPCGWVRFSDGILGDDTKFYDYYDSVDLGNVGEPLDLRTEFREPHELIDWVYSKSHSIDIDLDKLYHACPFKL